MSIIVDLILGTILVWTIIKHWRLGLACSILNTGRFFLSVIVAVLLCYPVASIMYSLGVSGALSGIISFVFLFVVTLLLSGLLVKLLSKIKIPIITKVDKFLGLLLGIVLGMIFISITATIIYTVIEVMSSVGNNGEVMMVYNDSYVFKFVYNLKIFEFIRNLF